jgi:2-keto-myo-inositol isomerase
VGAVAALGAAGASSNAGEAQARRLTSASIRPANEPFGYCLNTSTIRGNNLDIVGVVNAASKAGSHAIEPWIMELDRYTSGGGTLKDLGKWIADAGLTVGDAIALTSFLDDDDGRRAVSMENLKVDMDKVAQIGGTRIDPHTEPAILRRHARAWTSSDLRMQRRLTVAP